MDIKKLLLIPGLLVFSATSHAETLEEKILAKQAAGASKLPPEVKKSFKEGIAAVELSNVVKEAKQVGEIAPDFTLKNASGNEVTLSEELKKGPVVVTWYRGGW